MKDSRNTEIITSGRYLTIHRATGNAGFISGCRKLYFWSNKNGSNFTEKQAKLFVAEHNLNLDNDEISAVVVCNEKGDVLLLKRSPWSRVQGWCLPGGHVNSNESIREGAIRELFEETGIRAYPEELSFIGSSISMSGDPVVVFSLPCFSYEKIKLSQKHVAYAWAIDSIEWAGHTKFFIDMFFRYIEEE